MRFKNWTVSFAFFLALALASFVWAGDSPTGLDKGHFPYGMPGNTPQSALILHRDIYSLCNNGKTKFADWVAYVVTAASCEKKGETSRSWKQDPDLPATDTLAPADYKGASEALKVDRGHQAPLASFRGTDDWAQTNYLSNITPQKSDLNQGAWVRVEDDVRKLAAQNTVYVITGPLYERDMPKLPHASKEHTVPSGYWKIIAIKQADTAHPLAVIGFIFDQDTPRKADEMGYTATVDQIEARTGLDFFPELVDDIEAEVERCNSLRLQ